MIAVRKLVGMCHTSALWCAGHLTKWATVFARRAVSASHADLGAERAFVSPRAGALSASWLAKCVIETLADLAAVTTPRAKIAHVTAVGSGKTGKAVTFSLRADTGIGTVVPGTEWLVALLSSPPGVALAFAIDIT